MVVVVVVVVVDDVGLHSLNRQESTTGCHLVAVFSTRKVTDNKNKTKQKKRRLTVGDVDGIVAGLEARLEAGLVAVEPAVEFAEGGQGGRAHPHDQVLVLQSVVVLVVRIQVPQIPAPVLRLREVGVDCATEGHCQKKT